MVLFSRHNNLKLLGLICIGLFVTNITFFAIIIQPVSASPGILTLKWKVNPGNTITLIGPLAADLIPSRPGLEIVVTGGSTKYDTTSASKGDVTVLDGTNGKVIWKAKPAPIGIHQPFEVHDLNKDGIPEIIISAWEETVALHGNNGTVYWRAPAPADGTYPAIADIDGDGYPEIFVSAGDGPRTGYDWITSLSHDGKILHQTFSWHPCYGGLTIGDTNFDGRFELYQGDRASDYNPVNDTYKGGGKGVRALDAHTLTPLWNDPTILSSSHAPVLADVDKDGILDVIVVDQPGGTLHVGNGLAVLRSSDGKPTLTPDGRRRKSSGIDFSGHSQPTVYDIDGDGNLEIISSYMKYNGTATWVWDLYKWKLDTMLKDELGNNLHTSEPPKVGDVNGDGVMEIIAVTGQSKYPNQNKAIYIYDKDYHILEKTTLPVAASPFTLLQDVDNDGYNELILSSSSGTIFAFDTPAQAPSQRVRSGLQFYSEYKRGAAEYVPPPGPVQPVYRVGLESAEDTAASSNRGSITLAGVSYSLPGSASKTAGTYSAQYSADPGYAFHHWETTGSVSVSDANAVTTTLQVSGDGKLKAVYSAILYTLTITVSGSGSTEPTPGDHVYALGSNVSVNATPSLGWFFSQWVLDGVPAGSANPRYVLMNSDHTLKALFTQHIFESGFETGDFREWSRTSTTSGETAKVTQTLPYEGVYSAEFTSNANGQDESSYVYKSLSPTKSELYARAYVYVDVSGIVDNWDAHWFILFRSASSALARAGWYKVGGTLYWAITIRSGTNWVTKLAGTPSAGRWYSVELHWVKHGTNGYGELWVDGSLQGSLYDKDTDDFGDANDVRFGLVLWGCAPTKAYIDSVALDDEYIGPINAAPTIDYYTPTDTTPEVNEGASLEFTHTSSDPDGDPLTYSWLLDGLEQATTQNWTYSPSYDAAGTHNVTLEVSDGKLSDTQYWNVTVVDQPISYVHLESEENTTGTFNLGSITLDGASYTLPSDASKPTGTYSVEYIAAGGYSFDHWETTGLISVSDQYSATTTVTISGDGTPKAVYRKTL